jgi:hypothetical protein
MEHELVGDAAMSRDDGAPAAATTAAGAGAGLGGGGGVGGARRRRGFAGVVVHGNYYKL